MLWVKPTCPLKYVFLLWPQFQDVQTSWNGGQGRISTNRSIITILCCLAAQVGFASVLKWILLIVCFLCHFYYLFCCLAHTGPELDFGPYVWKASCSWFLHTARSFNKSVPFVCAFLTEWLIMAIGNRAQTDNLLKMTHFCARLGAPWLIIARSKLALCYKRKPSQRGSEQPAHCAFVCPESSSLPGAANSSLESPAVKGRGRLPQPMHCTQLARYCLSAMNMGTTGECHSGKHLQIEILHCSCFPFSTFLSSFSSCHLQQMVACGPEPLELFSSSASGLKKRQD